MKKREWKKKKELLAELEALQSKGVKGLDEELKDLEDKYGDLRRQLDDYQKPLEEEIYRKKNKLKDMKLEYSFKHEQIKEIKKNIKKSLAELKYKKEMLKFIEEEYAKIPKDVNRNQYIKRINEVVNNVKSQQDEIKRTLSDITQIQNESYDQLKKISKLDKEVEDILFKPAQKDKVCKSLYESFIHLKDAFKTLIDNVQSQNTVRNATKEVQLKIDSFKGEYKIILFSLYSQNTLHK